MVSRISFQLVHDSKASRPLYWFALLALTSCLKPELDPLNFFQVVTQEATINNQSLAGQVTFRGKLIMSAEGPDIVEEYGFFLANDRGLLEVKETSVKHISFVDHKGGGLDYEHTLMTENGRTYFYQAYAKSAGRLMRGEILSFSKQVEMDLIVLGRQNDSISVRVALSELIPQTVADFGFLWSKDNPNPTLESIEMQVSFGAQKQDITIDTLVGRFSFNSQYFFRPYFIVNNVVMLGPTTDFLVTDGWLRGENMVEPLKEASATSTFDDQDGFFTWVLGGTSTDANNNDQVYGFDHGDEKWFDSGYPAKPFKEGLAISWVDEIYYGHGEGIGHWYRFPDEYPITFCISDPIRQTINGIVFNDDEAIYYGTGKVRNEQSNDISLTNDIWELRKEGNCFSSRQLASLPVMDRFMGERDWGRQGALSFVFAGSLYAGGGLGPSYELNDLWRFYPPDRSNPIDTGDWEFICQFPGDSRTDAITFTVGDRVFFGTGFNPVSGYYSDIWEYTPDQQSCWTEREPLPGKGRRLAIAFGNDQRGYVAGGQPPPENRSVQILNDTWIYVPPIN